jgi:hypothetical protein
MESEPLHPTHSRSHLRSVNRGGFHLDNRRPSSLSFPKEPLYVLFPRVLRKRRLDRLLQYLNCDTPPLHRSAPLEEKGCALAIPK